MSRNSQQLELETYSVNIHSGDNWFPVPVVFNCLAGALRYWLNQYHDKHVRVLNNRGTLYYELSSSYYVHPQATLVIERFHSIKNRVLQIERRHNILLDGIFGDLAIEADLNYSVISDISDEIVHVCWEKEGF